MHKSLITTSAIAISILLMGADSRAVELSGLPFERPEETEATKQNKDLVTHHKNLGDVHAKLAKTLAAIPTAKKKEEKAKLEAERVELQQKVAQIQQSVTKIMAAIRAKQPKKP